MSESDPPGLPDWLLPLVRAVGPGSTVDFVRYGAVPPAGGGRRSAVLILLGEEAAGPDVLLIERAAQLRTHAGQPAFPGGAADPGDHGPQDTALRESVEEVGLDPAGVRVVTLLPELYLPPTGFVVTPVLAWWHTPAAVGVVDIAEVARVERVPIAELVDPANRCRVRHPSGYTGPAFVVRGLTVWGFTGGLLDRLLELGGWTRPWDREDVRDLPQRALDLAARGVTPGAWSAGAAASAAGAGSTRDGSTGDGPAGAGPAEDWPAGDGLAGDGLAGHDDGPAAEDVVPQSGGAAERDGPVPPGGGCLPSGGHAGHPGHPGTVQR